MDIKWWFIIKKYPSGKIFTAGCFLGINKVSIGKLGVLNIRFACLLVCLLESKAPFDCSSLTLEHYKSDTFY